MSKLIFKVEISYLILAGYRDRIVLDPGILKSNGRSNKTHFTEFFILRTLVGKCSPSAFLKNKLFAQGLLGLMIMFWIVRVHVHSWKFLMQVLFYEKYKIHCGDHPKSYIIFERSTHDELVTQHFNKIPDSCNSQEIYLIYWCCINTWHAV